MKLPAPVFLWTGMGRRAVVREEEEAAAGEPAARELLAHRGEPRMAC